LLPRLLLVGLLLAASLAFAASQPAATVQAAPADAEVLWTVTARGHHCPVGKGGGIGIAFDGSNLLLSCLQNNVITAVSSDDGSLLATYEIDGIDSIGALAWDRSQNLLWACGGIGDDATVYSIDLIDRFATAELTDVPGCGNGLAYDGTDDTLWLSPDLDVDSDNPPRIYHFSLDGKQLGAFSGQLGNCASAGIAVGGDDLFLSNGRCREIYQAKSATPTETSLIATQPNRGVSTEDLECDDLTFGIGRPAIWSKSLNTNVITAFKLKPGDCGYGGLPPRGDGGPVVLTGIDAEDCGPPGFSDVNHGPTENYVKLVNSILRNTSNGGRGILVIGANGEGPKAFWTAIAGGTGKPVTFGDATSSLAGFRMVAIVGSAPETCDGLTAPQNDILGSRQADFAAFVNAGGGLLGNSQSDFPDQRQYAYISGIGRIVSAGVHQATCRGETSPGFCDITPTQAGELIGITNDLDLCCWHNVFVEHPKFLPVLATWDATKPPVAVAIGGRRVLVPVGISLSPATAVNPARTTHTVTATVTDANRLPRPGLRVDFHVVKGPNLGQRSDPGECAANADCTTDIDGQVSWSYRSNGEVGIDYIEACAPNPATDGEVCTRALKEWDSGKPSPRITPDKLDFGDQIVGRTSDPLPLVISNAGNGRLELGALTVTGLEPNELSIDPCAEKVLFGGDSCTAHVRITPAKAGPRVGTLTVSTSAGPASVPVLANGVAQALVATPSPLNFGDQPVGTVSPPRQLTLTNTGTVPLRLTAIRIAGQDSSAFGLTGATRPCPPADRALAIGASCTVGVTFHPDRLGGHQTSLQVVAFPIIRPNPLTELPPAESFTLDVSLAGTSLPAALAARPSPLQFGAQLIGKDSAPATISVQNLGPGPARLGTATLTGPNAARFRLDATRCAGLSLPARATCSLTVRIHPTGTAPISATLVLTSRDIAAPLVVSLTGSGRTPGTSTPKSNSPTTPTTPRSPAVPAVEIDPVLGPPGTVVHVTGTGFPAGEATLSWNPGIGEEGAKVASNGRIDDYLLVIPRDQLGDRQLVVTAAGGVTIQKPFLVVPPALAPPWPQSSTAPTGT
jgi:hypothetical protein